MLDPGGVQACGPPKVILVVPCYNEARRLDLDAFEERAQAMPGLSYLFVDDGSTDGTRALIEARCRTSPGIFDLMAFDQNQGKAEAVRSGVLHLEGSRPDFVGYWDADLATPLDELTRFLRVFEERPTVRIVLGSRVNLLGRSVRRHLLRHYLSRTFATVVATALELPVYDAQCGAKLFRGTTEVYDLFREPFHARWIFDTELLIRASESLVPDGSERLAEIAHEHPLMSWHDVTGSKLQVRGYLKALKDTARIYGHHKATTRFRGGFGGLSNRVASSTQAALQRLSTEDPEVSTSSRVLRGAALVPVFGAQLIWMRTRYWLIGPLVLQSRTPSGLRFRSRMPDFIQTYLYLFGVWEPDLSAYIEGNLRPGDTFVDVGANIGYHSLIAHRAVGREGQVVAIEASPQVLGWLQESLRANGATKGVRVVHAAASDAHGSMTIYGGPARNTGLTTSVAGRGFPREAEVRCAPLPDLLEPDELRRLRMVKIDVEGGEDRVLEGLGKLLDEAPQGVEFLLELSPQWWTDQAKAPLDVLTPFFEAGFHAYEIDNDLWPWRYLWPNRVVRPKRSHRDWSERPRRIDLVLSRTDAPML